MMRELDPQGYDEDKKKFSGSIIQIPSFFWIERRYCEIFDTGQFIKKSRIPPLRHMEYTCENSNCQFHKIAHV